MLYDLKLVLLIVLGGLLVSGVLPSVAFGLGLDLLSSKYKHSPPHRIAGVVLILSVLAVTYAAIHLMWASLR